MVTVTMENMELKSSLKKTGETQRIKCSQLRYKQNFRETYTGSTICE